MDSDDVQFEYQPIDTTKYDFRLLRLLPSQSLEIECELYDASLSETENHYEALSYAWGSPELVERISVNGYTLWITENLFAALQHLCLPDRDRILWIDGICIDQKNDMDKSVQVQQMGRVFSTATQVIMWLGKATKDILLLGKRLHELYVCAGEDDVKSLDPKDPHWKELWSNILPDIDTEAEARLRKGLRTILHRPYFQRIWILQEIALAKHVVVQISTISFASQVLNLVCVMLDEDPPSTCASILDVMPGPARAISWWNHERNLSTLLLKTQNSQATHQRDRIYAIRDMLSDPTELSITCPDYSEPLFELVQRVMNYILQKNRALCANILRLTTTFESYEVICVVRTEESHFDFVEDPELVRRGILSHLQDGDPAKIFLQDQTGLAIEFTSIIHHSWMNKHKIYGAYLKNITFEGRSVIMVIITNFGKAWTGFETGRLDSMLQILLDREIRAAGDEEDAKKQALEFFSTRSDISMVRNYLSIGADILPFPSDASSGEHESDGGSALEYAAHHDLLDLFQLLLDHGADPLHQSKKYGSVLIAAVASMTFDDWRREKTHAIAEKLLKAGADVNAPSSCFGSALIAALRCNSHDSSKQYLEVVQLLLDHGANPLTEWTGYGNPLQAAVITTFSSYTSAIVKLLLEAGANPKASSGKWEPALIAVAQNSSPYDEADIAKTVKLLIEYGAEVNAPGNEFNSALYAAVVRCLDSNGYETRVVTALLDAGANVDIKEKDGSTARDVAASALETCKAQHRKNFTHLISLLEGKVERACKE